MLDFNKKELMEQIIGALEGASVWQLRLVLEFVTAFIKKEE